MQQRMTWKVMALARVVALQIATSTSLRCDTFRCARGGRVGGWCDASLTHYIVTCHLSSPVACTRACRTPHSTFTILSRSCCFCCIAVASDSGTSRTTHEQNAMAARAIQPHTKHTPKVGCPHQRGRRKHACGVCAVSNNQRHVVVCRGHAHGPAGEEQRMFASH
jgi:hypothetical protein